MMTTTPAFNSDQELRERLINLLYSNSTLNTQIPAESNSRQLIKAVDVLFRYVQTGKIEDE